jgi:hypothetical protein
MFEIVFGEEAIANLRVFPAFLRNLILNKITEQLVHQPTRETQ